MKNIVVFSGAGMSAESGIDTFRKTGGLWETYKIEEVATPEAWHNNPKKVQDFYNMRRAQISKALPNEGHKTIGLLSQYGEVIVVTQNIDDLHERAGLSKVIHLHGNIRFAKSSGPRQEEVYYPINGDVLTLDDRCPDGYPLRPHIVWFGEDVLLYEQAKQIIEDADVFIVVGTSLNVYPAAGLVHFAKRATLKVVIDPDSELSVPNDFLHLKVNATAGMKQCIELIERSFRKL